MSVHVTSAVWKLPVGDPEAKLVLLKLADNANDDGIAWPSQRTLAADCEVSPATVNRRIKLLIERGFLEIFEPGQPHRSTRYRVPIERFSSETRRFTAENRGVSAMRETEASGTVKEPKPTATTPRRRSSSNSIVWDAFVEIFGDVHGRAESKARGTAVADVQRCLQAEKISEDEWPAEIAARARRYRHDWPTVALTDHALARHFSKFGSNGASGPKPPTIEDRVRTWTRSTGYRFVDAGEAAAIIAEIADLHDATTETMQRLKELVEIWKDEKSKIAGEEPADRRDTG